MAFLRHTMTNLADYYVIERGDGEYEDGIYTWEEAVEVVERFERQTDGIQGWMHTYRTIMVEPEDHLDLREFQRKRRTEL